MQMQLEHFATMYARDHRKGVFSDFYAEKNGFKHSRVTICEVTE